MRITTAASTVSALLSLFLLTAAATTAHADPVAEFDRLFNARSFAEALSHADANIPTAGRTPELWVRIGRANEAAESIERALACYMVAWRMNPELYDALLGIARIYNRMEQPESALPMAEAALRVNFTAEASWELARACIALNRPADARQALEKIIEVDAANVIANRELGNIYFNAGEFARAVPLLRRSFANQADGEVAFRLGRAFLETGVPDSAVVYLRAAIARNAHAAEARALQARALVAGRKFAEAVEPLEALLRASPNNIELLRMLADCFVRINDRERLAGIDRRIVAIDRRDLQTRLRLAAFAESKEDWETAFTMYREAAALDARNADLHRKAAAVAGRRGRNADAIAAMREYVKLKPDDAEAHRDLGDFQYANRDMDGALASYRTAIRLNPQLRGFHQRYAELVIARGQTAEVITALNAVIANGDADVGTYTTLGTIHHGQRQFAEAIRMFREALRLDPTNVDALVALARSHAAAGEINPAIVTLEQAVMMNAEAVAEYKELGDLYTRQQRPAEALRAYMRYLERNPDDRALAASVGVLLFQQERFADAARFLTMARTSDPAQMLIFAEASFRAGDAKSAIITLEALRGRRPRLPTIGRVLMLLGEAYEKDGQAGKAGQAYAEYIALPNIRDMEIAHRAALLQEKDNPTEAIRIYEANMRTYPNDIRNPLRLGLLFSQRNEHARALPLLQRTTQAADSDPEVWLQIAQIYGAMGRDSSELAAYRRYLRTNPQHPEANRRIGAILVRRGDLTNAMVHLEVANTISPNDPAVLALLARGYVQTNRNEEAIRVLTRAKAAVPDDADIRQQLFELYTLTGQPDMALAEIRELAGKTGEGRHQLAYGQMLVAQGKVSEAETMLRGLIERDPLNVDALMLRAHIMRAAGNLEQAVEVYEEIVSIQPGYAPALYEAAETFMQLRRPPRAETFYRRALRANPNFALAELGLALLFKSRGNMELYRQHLQNAQRLAPENDRVMAEVRAAAGGSQN
jgi:tetratricopeptide (TPR) repeat protein